MGDDGLAMMSHRGRAFYLLRRGDMTALGEEIEAVRGLVVRRMRLGTEPSSQAWTECAHSSRDDSNRPRR